MRGKVKEKPKFNRDQVIGSWVAGMAIITLFALPFVDSIHEWLRNIKHLEGYGAGFLVVFFWFVVSVRRSTAHITVAPAPTPKAPTIRIADHVVEAIKITRPSDDPNAKQKLSPPANFFKVDDVFMSYSDWWQNPHLIRKVFCGNDLCEMEGIFHRHNGHTVWTCPQCAQMYALPSTADTLYEHVTKLVNGWLLREGKELQLTSGAPRMLY